MPRPGAAARPDPVGPPGGTVAPSSEGAASPEGIDPPGGASARAAPPARSAAERDDGERPADAGPARDAPALSVLKLRREFLAAASALRCNAPGLNLQARRRRPEEPAETPVRVGYTCSKKVGGAVARNRAKRRLRAAAAEALPRAARPGWDYVLIGRHEATAARDFRDLVADLESGLARLHARADAGDRRAFGGPVSAPRGPRRGRGRPKPEAGG